MVFTLYILFFFRPLGKSINFEEKIKELNILGNLEGNRKLQYLLGVASILAISLGCYFFIDFIGYHVVALILLLAVSLLAMFFEIAPILLAAVLSALIWNFLFIEPQGTFKITTPEDALLFLMYFVIVIMNAVFTSRIRKLEVLARQKKEREKTLRLYNTVINSLSHELKTPISTIIGAVDTLKSDSLLLDQKQRQDLISEVDIAGHRLHQQVNNLLNMSRLESEFFKLQLDWYDINELVYSVINNNSTDPETHKIIFAENENLPLFRVDGLLIDQILHNILQNALLYTPPGSVIEIVARINRGDLELKVTDNGPGFPEDKLEKVFEKFYRLPKTATGGTGLGLSIAKGFANAHGGSISLRNLPTGGAMFTIRIPSESTQIKEAHD